MNLAPIADQGWTPNGEAPRASRDRFDLVLWAALAFPQSAPLLETEAFFGKGVRGSTEPGASTHDAPEATEGGEQTSSADRPDSSQDPRRTVRETSWDRSQGSQRGADSDGEKVKEAPKGVEGPKTHQVATQQGGETRSAAVEAEPAVTISGRIQGPVAGVRGGPVLPPQMVQGGGATRAAPALRGARGPSRGPGGPPASPATVLVPFKEADGLQGRIRLSLRGGALRATILTPNGETAQNLEARITEIQRALGERGFAEARVAVRQTRPPDSAGVRPDTGPARHNQDRGQGDGAGRESSRGRPHGDWKEEASS